MPNKGKTSFIIGFSVYSVLFIIPVMSILFHASPKDLVYVFTQTYYQKVISFTFKQAFFSALLSVLIGLPGAWIIKNRSFRLKKTVKNIFSISYVLPSILVVLGFVICYGNNGLIAKITGIKPNILYSFKAVVLAHVFYNFPVALNIIGSYWQTLNSDIENAARSTGASKLKVFLQISLPRLAPSIASAFSLIFLLCFTSFAIVLVLGGGPDLTTTEVEIYRQARISMNISRSSALAILSLTISSLFLALQATAESKYVKESELSSQKPFRKISFFSGLYIFVLCVFTILPIAGIIIKVFSSFSFNTLRMCSESLFNTIVIASFSSVLGTLLALACAPYLVSDNHHKIFDTISMLSLSVSSVIIGLSYFNISGVLSFVPKIILIILCHSMICFPFSLKTISSGFRSLPQSYVEAGKSLGASNLTILFKVELSAIKEEIATSIVFCFAISCGELNASMLIGGAEVSTIPVQIYRLIASYNYNGACEIGLVLVLICLIANSIKLKILDV